MLFILGPLVYVSFVGKELKMQGFLHGSYVAEHKSMLTDLKQWVNEVRNLKPICRKLSDEVYICSSSKNDYNIIIFSFNT